MNISAAKKKSNWWKSFNYSPQRKPCMAKSSNEDKHLIKHDLVFDYPPSIEAHKKQHWHFRFGSNRAGTESYNDWSNQSSQIFLIKSFLTEGDSFYPADVLMRSRFFATKSWHTHWNLRSVYFITHIPGGRSCIGFLAVFVLKATTRKCYIFYEMFKKWGAKAVA